MQSDIKAIKFSQKTQADFIHSLRGKVNEYFQKKQISKQGNTNMVFKTVFMFSLFLIPYFIMTSGIFTSTVIFFLLWIIMGFGMAGIGLSVMHDANHGSYSKNKRINKILGYTLNMLGGNSYLWKIQHNYLHHAYTNIEDADEDINVPVFLRFSPHAEKRSIQRFQHIYAWFFYALATLSWVTTKNFLQFFRYKQKGLIKGDKEFRTELIKEIMWKILYYFIFIGIPVMVLSFSIWIILAAFILMHMIIGLSLGSIFQPAHIMPTSQYPLPDNNGNMENNWAIHQLLTTSNYSPENRIFSWFIGGLNFQNEHHLFPNICHIHYYHISKIVRQASADFGIPYNTQPSFIRAIWNHIKMLKHLGKHDKKNQDEIVMTNKYVVT